MSNMPRISVADARRIEKYSLRNGDIVFSRVGRVGSCFMATGEHSGWIISGQLLRIRLPSTEICAPFLVCALRGDSAQDFIRDRSIGSTRKSINTRILSSLRVPVPPFPEQRKIATILSSVDDAIDKTHAVIDQVQVVKRGLMQELLTRGLPGQHTRFKQTKIGEMPDEWAVTVLRDCASIGNGTTPSKKRKEYWEQGTISWLPTGKVNDRIIDSANVYVTDRAVRETSLRVLPIGTLLVAMIGQGKTRGKVARLAIEACINQNFAYVIPRDVSSWFLFYVLEHQYDALGNSGRGSNQDALNCKIIVTTRASYRRRVRRERFEWPPEDCIPGSPWTGGSLRFGNRLRRTFGCGSTRRLSA